MRKDLSYQQGSSIPFKLHFLILICFIVFGCAPTYVSRVPNPEKPLMFPRDHGGHEDAQWEWWYYNSRIETESGKTYDYFWSFFKVYVDGDSMPPCCRRIRCTDIILTVE